MSHFLITGGKSVIGVATDNGTCDAYVDITKDDLSEVPKLDYSKLTN